MRDQLWIGDQHRDDLFALQQPQRPFLAQTVLELAGRLDARGEEVEPLVLDQPLRRRLEELRRSGLDVAVVALLHAQRNPAHEQRCAAVKLTKLSSDSLNCEKRKRHMHVFGM